MYIAICDDEEIFVKKMIYDIETKYKTLDFRIKKFDSGENLLEHYKKKKRHFDVILLDIEMNGLNGIETAKQLRKYTPDVLIIFVTSHEELACTGYEVSAFRFITKPINVPKLIEALNSAAEQLRQNKNILIETNFGEYSLKISDILYIEAQNQHVIIYTEHEKYIQRASISKYERTLVLDNFQLIHRSYLVNMCHVKGVSKQEVTLNKKLKLPLSRLRYKKFQEQFHNYINTTAF
jgi:Response regulator of the LytR/AlgR family